MYSMSASRKCNCFQKKEERIQLKKRKFIAWKNLFISYRCLVWVIVVDFKAQVKLQEDAVSGGVHRSVPVIFRGRMLNKNPGTCGTSSRQRIGQRFSMCTHTKYVTHMAKCESCSVISYLYNERLSICAMATSIFWPLWSKSSSCNTTLTRFFFIKLNLLIC